MTIEELEKKLKLVQEEFEKALKLAQDPKTDPDTLAILSYNKSSLVRATVALNPSTPPHALERLTEDSLPWIRSGAIMNRNTPVATLAKILQEHLDQAAFVALKLFGRRDELPEDPKLLRAIWEALPYDFLREQLEAHPIWKRVMGKTEERRDP